MRYTLALALVLAASSALGHSWYDPWCCNNQDCRAVHPDEVKAMPDGYHYQQWVMPYSQARPSGDKDFHVCVMFGQLRCLYAPPGGV